MQEDPLGILKGSEDPLGIFKKKDGGSVSQKPAQSPLIASQTEAEQPTQSPFVDPEELKKRYERVALGTNTLNSVIENKYSKDPLFAKSSSQFIRNSNELNAKGMKPERTSLVYDFFNKDINSDDNIRDSFISSQYAGAYFSESPELKSEYEKSDLKDVLTPRQYTGLKSLSFGKQSKYQDYVKKLKEANELDKEVAKIELDKIGVDIDQDAAASMYNEGLNVDIANNIYSKAKNDSPLLDERLRQIDYENPYSLRTFGNIVTGAVNRGLTVGSTADILTATADEAGVDVDRLAQLQKDLNNSKATKAYEQFSNDPSIENFKKNPIGILLEQGLESLAALYSHGATRMAAGAGTGAAMGSIVPGVGTAAGASSGVIAGLGMASLNLEYSSKILEGLGQLGVDVTDAAQLKNALADDKIMADLKADGLKKGVPVALFDMLSAGIAGKIISKPAKSIAGRVMQGAAETGVQSALGAAGEATGQIVSEGKITSPNAILMEAIGELGPGTIEIAYGNAVEAAKRNRSISKKDIVAISKSAEAKNNIDAEIASGNLTEEQGALLKKEVATVEANLNKVPQDLSDGAKAQLVDLVDKKSKLIEQEKNLDAAFKPEIQNQIKEIDNQILNITKSDRDATTESSKPVQEGAAESNIGEPTGVVQGQREGGAGEGIQGEATLPKADVGDSNLGSKTEIAPGKKLFNEPVPEVAAVEAEFKKSKGINTPEPAPITKLDEEKSKTIADAYEALVDSPNDPEVQSAYQAMADETMEQFDAIDKAGVKVEIWTGKGEPYKNSGEMIADVRDNKHMYIFSTEEGFGDTPITDEQRQQNALLRDSGIKDVNGKPLLINDIFRFVHDYFGHSRLGNSFGAIGEENAWNVHARMYSPLARRAMTTETRGQNSWVNFNKNFRNPDGTMKKKGDEGYVPPAQRPFAEQKMALLPEEFSQIEDAYSVKPTVAEELTQELIKDPVAKVQQSLKSAGITVDLIADPAEFDRQVQQLGGQAGMEGVFLADDGKVLLNEQKLKEGTNAGRIIFHEATHPIINIIRNTNPALYNRVVAGINAASDNPAIQQAKAWVESNKNVYDTDVKKEDETLVETIAMVGDGTLDLNTIETGFKQALIEVINTIARALGFKPVLNDTDVAAFKKLAAQIADVLTSGRDIAEVVGKENVKEYGVPVGIPTQPKAPEKYGTKVKHDGGQYKLSFVKPSDIIDIKSLVEDIVSNKQKVWFWTADQLGRGMYFDNVINGEHYLDAGPSFALDPKNREKGVIWATGKGKKWVEDKIANSDYIFIMSGSPQKSKLFNKRVAEITFNRIKKAVGEEGAWDKFKSEVLSVSKIGKINEILNKYNSFEDLLASPDRKELLIQFDAQKEKKSTPLKGLLDRYGVLMDYNDLRDGFYRENGFDLNDVMLVLKPTGFGGKSEHSTYENDILGEVVGVPDRKVNSYDLMTDEFKKKYTEGMSRTEQSQAVAPYGVGIRDIQASAGNRLAPNGKPSNLTEKQYQQVRTPEFKKWFGDWENDPANASKVVDENGEPLVVYHGTKGDFDIFKANKDIVATGVFFTSNQSYAQRFPRKGNDGASKVMSLYLDIKKPISEEEFFSIGNNGQERTEESIKAGYDGVAANDGVFIAFEPNQIKSATANVGTFSTEDARIQFSAGNREIINGFYSPIQKRVNEFKQPKASVQKWKEIVGTKTDEAVFSGLADWLGGMKPDRQLTKEEVNNFMSDNRIEINEVTLNDGKPINPNEWIEESDGVYKNGGWRINETAFMDYYITDPSGERIEGTWSSIEGAKDRVEQDFSVGGSTKYSQYQLPGGENYKEILITLPGKDQFKSSHFDETNIITHLRMNTRTDVDGNKVLFLEEVQSDWGQKGKKEGFKVEDKALQERYNEASRKANEADIKLIEAMREYRQTNPNSSINSAISAGDKNIEKLYNEYQKLEEEKLSMLPAVRKVNQGVQPAPYVTNTNAWVKLGLKVALKEAIRQGADMIAWTTGQQQNDRYNLSKQVDKIKYAKENGKYGIIAEKNGVDVFDKMNMSESELAETVGKDIAEKIISNQGSAGTGFDYGFTVIEGDNLKVGGKGMKDFYGDAQNVGIVGKVAKALVKELTGKEGEIAVSKISTPQLPKDISVGEIQAAGGVDAVKAKQMSDQPAIEITPELVQAVEGGLPQFSAGNRPENNQNFKLAAFVMRKKAEGATDGEIAIGIASVTGMKPEDIKTIIDNPEQFIRDSFPSMSKLQQDNLIQKAKIQDIYRGRQFGKPIDKPFMGLEVPQEMVDDYLDKTGRADRNVKDWAKDFKRKWLDPAKGLPDWTLAIKDFATGAKNIEVARAANTIQRLKDTAKQIGFKDWDAFSEALVMAKDVQRFIPDETGVVPFDVYRAAANRATPDDKLPALVPDAIKKLPDEIIPFAYAMRGQIDNLTRDLIGSGYVTPEQAVVLEKNLGAYTNRAYKMFSERGYVPEKKVYNAAVKFLTDQKLPQLQTDNVGVLTDKQITEKAIEEAKKDVEIYLSKKKNPYFGSKSDRRDTGILQERKDIPEPIRDLMGQYTDPGTVFIMTVAKQAALKSASQYLNKLRTMGMGTLFFEREDPSRPLEYSVEIAAKGSESMNPLGGLLTTKEIAEALDMVDPTYNDLTETWMKLVGMVRWGKTVGSVATQFKNFESNGGFAVLNGYMLSGENTQAFKAAAKYVKGQYSKGEIDAITDKVIRLNLVGQSVGMRELKEMLGSGDVHDIALDIALNPEGKWGKRVAKKVDVLGAANKLYRLGDDFWKVYAYMVEREQISDARFNGAKYDSLTKQQQEQVDIESSERVKNTWPTYDRVVEGAKFVSKRAPIFGNFISFQAESLRALTNSIKLAKQDLSDPQMRHLGVRRMAGITAYIGLRSAITIGLAKMAGFAAAGILGSMFGDDEEERNKRAIREALPPFMRTGDLAVTQGEKPHQYTVVNMSSLDPYGVVPNSLNAFTEGREGIFGRTMEPGILAAGAELFSGFLEPEMTFETMWSVINNKDPKTGEQLVMETDTDLQASAKVAAKIWDQLEPSTVSMIQRLYERDNKEAELLALGGARPYDVDLHKSFGFVLSRFGKDIDAINKEYNRIKYDDKMTEQEKEAAEKVAEDKKAFAISKVSQIYRDFINIGADPKVLDELINQKSAVKVTGYDKNTKKSIKTGKISKEKLFK